MGGVLAITWMSAMGAIEILMWKWQGAEIALNVGLGLCLLSAIVFGLIYKRMVDDMG